MTRAFARFTPPAPPPPAVCIGCRAMVPDVLVPGELANRDGQQLEMCWLCAHLVTAHDVVLGTTGLGPHRMCKCAREAIYPHRTWPDLVPEVTAEDVTNVLDLASSWSDVAAAHSQGWTGGPSKAAKRQGQARSASTRAGRANSQLTPDSVRQIRQRATSERYADLAKEYGVSTCTISNVVARITWSDVR